MKKMFDVGWPCERYTANSFRSEMPQTPVDLETMGPRLRSSEIDEDRDTYKNYSPKLVETIRGIEKDIEEWKKLATSESEEEIEELTETKRKLLKSLKKRQERTKGARNSIASVNKNVIDALNHLKTLDKDLFTHLKKSIRRGQSLSYAPTTNISWRLGQ